MQELDVQETILKLIAHMNKIRRYLGTYEIEDKEIITYKPTSKTRKVNPVKDKEII